MQAPRRGQVRVGSRHTAGKTTVDPKYPGFTNIVSLTKSTKYGMLGPYVLTVPIKIGGIKHEILFENLYQSSKIYAVVPGTKQVKSRFDRTLIWEWPEQEHYRQIKNPDGSVSDYYTPEYFHWRTSIMLAKEPVRYPVGIKYRGDCLFAIRCDENGILDPRKFNYVESRREIYLRDYLPALKAHPEFKKLKARVDRGENLLIIEVDCCQEESIDYYMQTYGVPRNFIEQGTMLATEENFNILLNDTRHRWGHGFVIAGALAGFY